MLVSIYFSHCDKEHCYLAFYLRFYLWLITELFDIIYSLWGAMQCGRLHVWIQDFDNGKEFIRKQDIHLYGG